MILPKDAYSSILKYLKESFSFKFLDKIPGGDKDSKTQSEAIIRFIESYSENKTFLGYSAIMFDLVNQNFINQIMTLRWKSDALKSSNKNSIIEEDKFGLEEYENVYFVLLLLIVRCIFHSQPIATLPIFNEYKYKAHAFKHDVRETIDFAVRSIISIEPSINTVFLSLSAKSIIPYKDTSVDISSVSRLTNILFHFAKISYLYRHEDNNAYTKSMFLSLMSNLINNASFLGLDYNMICSLYRKALLGELDWKS